MGNGWERRSTLNSWGEAFRPRGDLGISVWERRGPRRQFQMPPRAAALPEYEAVQRCAVSSVEEG